MVSGFCNIARGFLSLTDEQMKVAKDEHKYEGPQTSRVTLELGGDTPWFDSDQLLVQVEGFHQVSTKRCVHVCVCLRIDFDTQRTNQPILSTTTHLDRVLLQYAPVECAIRRTCGMLR